MKRALDRHVGIVVGGIPGVYIPSDMKLFFDSGHTPF